MSPEITLDYQIADDLESHANLPAYEDVLHCLDITIKHINYQKALEISIRIVNEEESHHLNNTYRGKDKPTNVLSFASDLPDFIPSQHIGDLVICAAIVKQEAQTQNKVVSHHWTHMCIHGLLHLLGYDHINEQDAEDMETLETAILAKLNIDNPYQLK